MIFAAHEQRERGREGEEREGERKKEREKERKGGRKKKRREKERKGGKKKEREGRGKEEKRDGLHFSSSFLDAVLGFGRIWT